MFLDLPTVIERSVRGFSFHRREVEETRETIERQRTDLRLAIMQTMARIAELRATVRQIDRHLQRGETLPILRDGVGSADDKDYPKFEHVSEIG